MNTATQLTNDIVARHQLLGDLCLEATLSYENENYTAALACLFVLTEASLKFAIEDDPEDKWGLDMSINEAKKKGFITKEQAKELRFYSFLETLYSTKIRARASSNIVESSFLLQTPKQKNFSLKLYDHGYL